MSPVGRENDHCRDHFRPTLGQSRAVEANVTASLMCQEKEGKALQIIKLKYFLYSNFL